MSRILTRGALKAGIMQTMEQIEKAVHDKYGPHDLVVLTNGFDNHDIVHVNGKDMHIKMFMSTKIEICTLDFLFTKEDDDLRGKLEALQNTAEQVAAHAESQSYKLATPVYGEYEYGPAVTRVYFHCYGIKPVD